MDPKVKERKLKRQKLKRSNKEKRTRKERIKAGLCTRCGKNPADTGRMCIRCKWRGTRYIEDSNARRKYNG